MITASAQTVGFGVTLAGRCLLGGAGLAILIAGAACVYTHSASYLDSVSRAQRLAAAAAFTSAIMLVGAFFAG
jgi:hypothetical protein